MEWRPEAACPSGAGSSPVVEESSGS
jgi:hypothetical protein